VVVGVKEVEEGLVIEMGRVVVLTFSVQVLLRSRFLFEWAIVLEVLLLQEWWLFHEDAA